MIDVHCHLNFKAFAGDYDTVIKDALAAGVTRIINVGTQVSSSQRAVELAKEYGNLYAIVGIHPHHADKDEIKDNWFEKLEMLAANKENKVVAIGEIGLDNYRYKSNGIADPVLQKDVFIQQIQLASKLKLPIQIHNRHAGKEILDVLIHHKSLLLNPPGMFHCMSGDVAFLKKVLAMGFYVGFDGNITYAGLASGETTALSELVKYAPLERIVTETDSPYLAPEPHRGGRNVPAYGILIGEFIAHIKGISVSEVITKTTKNAIEVFRLREVV